MIKHVAAHEFEDFVYKSRKTLVLVDFWAQWCKPCTAMEPALENIARKFTMALDIVKVNVDDEKEISNAFKVRSIPTMMFFLNGQVLIDKTLVGTKTETELTGHIANILNIK